MELSIEEDKDTRLVFEVSGVSHTFCNALKDEIANVDDVVVSTYDKKHPQVGSPRFFVETEEDDPRDAIDEAVTNLKEKNEEFLENYQSI